MFTALRHFRKFCQRQLRIGDNAEFRLILPTNLCKVGVNDVALIEVVWSVSYVTGSIMYRLHYGNVLVLRPPIELEFAQL
jgi:hypothetical protein